MASEKVILSFFGQNRQFQVILGRFSSFWVLFFGQNTSLEFNKVHFLKLLSKPLAHSTGLRKLAETNELVESMQIELTELEPILKVKSKETDELMESLAIDQEAADKVKVNVLADEKVAKIKAEETKAIADDAQRDLDQALPMLEAANKALDGLDKSDIAEIRVFKTPPELVVMTMEAVCILMDQKSDWSGAKVMLGDSQFMSKLINFDKDNVPMKILKKLKKYIDNPSF